MNFWVAWNQRLLAEVYLSRFRLLLTNMPEAFVDALNVSLVWRTDAIGIEKLWDVSKGPIAAFSELDLLRRDLHLE